MRSNPAREAKLREVLVDPTAKWSSDVRCIGRDFRGEVRKGDFIVRKTGVCKTHERAQMLADRWLVRITSAPPLAQFALATAKASEIDL